MIVTSHILCAAMEHLDMETLDSDPNSEIIPQYIWLCSKSEKQEILHDVAMAIIDNTVDLSTTFSNDIDDTPSIMIDHIMEYACEVVSLGLLFLNYRDAIKEGDGEWVILCWKYMLLIFKATNRSNYAVEALSSVG